MMGRVKRLARDNMPAKILAVIAACALWLYVGYEQNPMVSRTYALELEPRSLSPKLVLTEPAAGIRVRVSGARYRLAEVSARDMTAYVDLQGLEKGSYDKQVQVQVPAGLQVEEVLPSQVTVNADILASRNFPVNIRFDEQLPPALSAKVTGAEPNIVRIYGPAQFLDNTSLVEAAFNIDHVMAARGEYKIAVPLSVFDKDHNPYGKVTVEPNSVNLTVQVTDKIVSKNVPVKIAFTGSLPDGYQLAGTEITPNNITVTGLFANMNNIKEVLTDGVALDNLTRDFSFLLNLHLPPGITADNTRVHVHLTVAKRAAE